MRGRDRQLRAGAVFVGSVALVFIGSVTAAWTKFWERRDTYTIHFTENVAGLDVGAPLKINGVSVGRVDSIELDTSNIETVVVEVSIQGGLPLRRDATATVGSGGITGLKFVEVDPGTNSQGVLPPGSRIPEGTSTMAAWTSRAQDIALQFKQLQTRIGELTDEETSEHVESIGEELRRLIARIAMLVREMTAIIDENRPELQRTVKNITELTKSVSKTSSEVSTTTRVVGEDLDRTVTAGRSAAEQISVLAERTKVAAETTQGLINDAKGSVSRERLGKTMGTLQTTLQSMTRVVVSLQQASEGNRDNLEATAQALRDLSQHLGDFSDTFNQNPAALIKREGMPEREPP